MNQNHLLILVILIVSATALLLACDSDDESDAVGLVDDDDNDSGDDDDGSSKSLGTNECGTYWESGCTDSDDRACTCADLANEHRLEYPEESGCAPSLQWSEALAAVALAHSKDMCDRNFFEHDNPDNESPFDRMDNAGITWVSAGENIAMGTGLSSEQADGLWMDEPICESNHRSNILSRWFTHIGVGVYDCGANVYITQDFATFSFGDLPEGDHPFCGPGF